MRRYVSASTLPWWFVYAARVTHPTRAELINSADPNAKGEPQAAISEPGRCRAGKMKERSGPLILPKKVGMFVQLSLIHI